MSVVTRQWFPIPSELIDVDPQLYDGDSYLVRLADGTEVWANYWEHAENVISSDDFEPCDDDGNKTGDFAMSVVAVFSTRKMVW